MQIKWVSFSLAASAIVLMGCTRQLPAASTNATETPQDSKVGKTTKSGQIIHLENKYYIQETGQQPLEISSYNIDLSNYVGRSVTITGEYSGNTLFVGEIH